MDKELIDQDTAGMLVREARKAAMASYSPYSRFSVGAAVLCVDGSVVRGTNVENASYGLSMCAERSALFAGVAAGKKGFLGLAVTCPDADEALGVRGRMPCGACRQVISELCDADCFVIVDGVGTFGIDELLPLSFDLGG